MLDISVNSALDLGIILTMAGLLIIYFGRVIVKSRKELVKDYLAESLNGIFFIADLIVIPSLIVYSILMVIFTFVAPLITKDPYPYKDFAFFVMSSIFIIIQYKIFKHYHGKLKTTAKTSRKVNIFVGVFLVTFTYLIYEYSTLYFFSICLIMNFLILTFVACRDHYRDEKILDGKYLNISFLSKRKPINAKISRIGDDFILFEQKNGNNLIINKSDIASISH